MQRLALNLLLVSAISLGAQTTFCPYDMPSRDPDCHPGFDAPIGEKFIPPAKCKGSPVRQIGGSVSMPILLHKVDMQPPAKTIRSKPHRQDVLINLVVDRDGVPRCLLILRNAGAGWDQAAIDAALQWRFKPAFYKGEAVPVSLNVELPIRP